MDPLNTIPDDQDTKRSLLFKIVQKTRMNRGLPPFPVYDPGESEWNLYFKWLTALES